MMIKKKPVGRPKKPRHLKKVHLGVVIDPDLMIDLSKRLDSNQNLSEVVGRILRQGLSINT